MKEQQTSEPLADAASQTAAIKKLFEDYVVPSYGRFNLVLCRGAGSYVWDMAGKRYLDLGSGIAVCCLGHAHPAITEALIAQSQSLVHVSNLYYHEPQGRLAEALVKLIGPGKYFFCNSGAEANEGLFKLARKFGHDEGRFEILTTLNSFHGRTLAGIAATGQEKVKKGFAPMTPGFRHVPFNDLAAMRQAVSPATVAILIEGVQGEGGITPATPEYLLGLRQLCNERNLLLFIDGVQCGYFRTGRFQSYQRILEGTPDGDKFLPDGVAMAKSLAGGIPMGAFWVRQPYADLLSPGTHASTFGGTPLACAVALKVLEVVQQNQLPNHARGIGHFLQQELLQLAHKHPHLISRVRGLGLMLGLELNAAIASTDSNQKTAAAHMTDQLHQAGLLVIPAGSNIIRFLPPLNLSHAEAQEAIDILDSVLLHPRH